MSYIHNAATFGKIKAIAVIPFLLFGCDAAMMSDGMSMGGFSQIVGKTLSNDMATVVIQPNGSLVGQFRNGSTLNGTWTEENGLFCREGVLSSPSGGNTTIARECQRVQIAGQTASFYNQDGSLSSTYSVQ